LRFFFFKREAGADECANESLKSNTESPEITTKTYSAKRGFSKCERQRQKERESIHTWKKPEEL
jgi:hypothetical protein